MMHGMEEGKAWEAEHELERQSKGRAKAEHQNTKGGACAEARENEAEQIMSMRIRGA